MIRKLCYEWTLTGNGVASSVNYPVAGQSFSIFSSGFGALSLTRPGGTAIQSDTQIGEKLIPFVNEEQFVVIDHFGSTPGVTCAPQFSGVNLTEWVPNGWCQIDINSTSYYQGPQNVQSSGISGDASNYPLTKTPEQKIHYMLKPSVYVRPEQSWDILYTFYNDISGYISNNTDGVTTIPTTTTLARVFIQYWLFEGTDAMICHRLLDLGIPVNVANVEWYRQQLLLSRGLDTETWEYYLRVSKKYRELEERRKDHLRRAGIRTKASRLSGNGRTF